MSNTQSISKVSLVFSDNHVLQQLVGAQNSYLKRLESQLHIKIYSRGNMLLIQGEEQAVEKAKAILEKLEKRLLNGETIDYHDVDGGVRMHRIAYEGNNMKIHLKATNKSILPRSPSQKTFIEAMEKDELVFGIGPAGTGKTYLAVAMGASLLMAGKVERLILSRPAIEAGERLGFLPGDLKEKVDPYLRPIYDALYDMFPSAQLEKLMASGAIEIAPLAFMRGRTLSHAYVILDEAQNTTPLQMKMFLTRLGEGSRMVVTGDVTQVDLAPQQESGLLDAQKRFQNIPSISFIEFGAEDVVRHPLVAKIVKAYGTP
jgi:phosphate starvation-inducible PhoH-like protein